MMEDQEYQTITIKFDIDEIDDLILILNKNNFKEIISVAAQKVINDYFGCSEITNENKYYLNDDSSEFPGSEWLDSWKLYDYVPFDTDHEKQVNDWCKKNCEGRWYFFIDFLRDGIVFEKQTDLVLFKLLF